MPPQLAQQIAARVAYLNENRVVIDADTHISNPELYGDAMVERVAETANYFHGRPITAEQLLQEMVLASVDTSLAWQNPSVTSNDGTRSENFDALLAANRYVYEASVRYPKRIIPAGWTDPKALGANRAMRMVDECVIGFGMSIVKMNPAQGGYDMGGEHVLEVTDHIVARGAVPAFHYGADTPHTPVSALRTIAERIAPHPVIGIHMGGGGASYVAADEQYIASRALGLEHPNIHYILSTKRDAHIRSALITYQYAGEPFSRNLSCASDAPYGVPAWNFGGFRALFAGLSSSAEYPDWRIRQHPGLFSEEDVARYMGGNIAALVLQAYERVAAQG